MIIDIYGLTIECQAESQDLASELIRPFAYFKKEKVSAAITIIVKEKKPPYETFSNAEARFSTPRNIVYKNKEYKIIDYFGKGAVVEDIKKSLYYLYSPEKNFLIEAFYLLVLSLFGQFCDTHGMLRIHALGLSYKDHAFLFLIPPGGGKSTIALAMLQEKDFKLISDDEVILDKHGRILPFPLRIGVLDRNSVAFIPDKYIYRIDRMEFSSKYFIDCEYWKDKIETNFLKNITLVSIRMVLKGEQSIKHISKNRMFRSLMRDAVAGIGLYQGLEFIFKNSMWEVFAKIPCVLKRFIMATRLLFISKSYEFTVTRDIDKNSRILKDVLRKIAQNSRL